MFVSKKFVSIWSKGGRVSYDYDEEDTSRIYEYDIGTTLCYIVVLLDGCVDVQDMESK